MESLKGWELLDWCGRADARLKGSGVCFKHLELGLCSSACRFPRRAAAGAPAAAYT